MNNITDASVRICGEGNIVMNLAFTTPEAKLILEGSAAAATVVSGVPEERILRV